MAGLEGVLLNQPIALYFRDYAEPIVTPPTVDEEVLLVPGSGAAATASFAGGAVTAIAVDDGGESYLVAPLVQLSGGGGSGAAATASIAGGVVTAVAVDDGGSGYTSEPTVSFVSQEEIWTPIGESPAISELYGTDGVTIRKPNAITKYEGSGELGPVDAYRTGDGLEAECMLYDNRLEMWAFALDLEISEVAAASGTIGTQEMGMSRPKSIKSYHVLARGPSARNENYVGQFFIPSAKVMSSWEPKFTVKDLTGYSIMLESFVDLHQSDAAKRLGSYIQQSADALP